MSATQTTTVSTPAMTEPTPKQGMLPSVVAFAPYVISFALFLLTWLVMADYVVRSALFPSPVAVFGEAIVLLQDGTLVENVEQSLGRIMLGFLLGSMIGVPIGLAIGSFRLARKLIEPWTEFLRFIPATAMITVAVIWFASVRNRRSS